MTKQSRNDGSNDGKDNTPIKTLTAKAFVPAKNHKQKNKERRLGKINDRAPAKRSKTTYTWSEIVEFFAQYPDLELLEDSESNWTSQTRIPSKRTIKHRFGGIKIRHTVISALTSGVALFSVLTEAEKAASNKIRSKTLRDRDLGDSRLKEAGAINEFFKGTQIKIMPLMDLLTADIAIQRMDGTWVPIQVKSAHLNHCGVNYSVTKKDGAKGNTIDFNATDMY